MKFAVAYTKQAEAELLAFPAKVQRQLKTKIAGSRAASPATSRNSKPPITSIGSVPATSGFCLNSTAQTLSSSRFEIENKPMNKPGLKTTLTQIQRQRASLARVRAKTEDLEDYLAALEARARDTGERIPLAKVHGRAASRKLSAAR